MTRAVPWNINGVDFDAREAAKVAARRAGLSLGEWLNNVIAEQAADLGVNFDDIGERDRLEAVTARLATLSSRPAQNSLRNTRRSDRYGREAAPKMPAPDEDLVEPRRTRAVDEDVGRYGPAPFDPEQLLDRAVTAFDRRARLAHDHTSAALEKVSRRLTDIEGRIEANAQPRVEPFSKELMSRLEARLDGISRRQGVAQDVGGRLGELDRKLAAIANRLDRAETKEPEIGRPDDVARIEAKLNRLSETIDRAVRPPSASSAPERSRFARRSVADAVAEITQRQAMLDPDMRPVSAPEQAGDLRSELAALSTRFEDMRRDGTARDEQQFRAIGEKLDALGAQRPDIATLARIRAQTEEIRNLLAAAVARPMPIENIERQIAALAQRVDAIATLGPSPAALAQVDAHLAEIRAALEKPVTAPVLEQIESRIEALTGKVEEALSNASGSVQLDELTERLDFVHRSLAARMERPAVAVDTVAFEGMMRDIVGKLAQPARSMDVAPGLEDLISRLSDRLDTPAPAGRLEELVRDLAEKIDTVSASRADLQALDGLQEQIARLAQRLDKADADTGAFGSLERSISDLFTGLEETRRAAIVAAETAARDAVREGLLASPAEPRVSADAQTDHVTRELADLRALQDAADRQTHATLTAVHETLEKVVDRLAMLEDDIVDVRNSASEELSAAGPLPLFASSQRGDGRIGSHAQNEAPAPRLDDRDFLIEPGTGFSPERRLAEAPVRPPFPPDSKPPAPPPSAPSAPPVPPQSGSTQAGSTQANFIAAARRTIQVNAENAAPASNRKVANALDGALADARSRARAAAAALLDESDRPQKEAGKQRRPGALARASAFFSNSKRPLVLSLAGIVVVLCALELVRNQTSPQVARIDETSIPMPAKAAPGRGADPVKLSPSLSNSASGTAGPSTSAGASDAGAAPDKSSSIAAPGVDPSPVGSIGTKPSVSAAPVLAAAPFGAPLASTAVSDLPAIRDLASRGNAAAEFELGVRYADGRGLPHDLRLASEWLEKSAQQNIAPAQYRLGTLYEKGLGVTRNAPVAINWYRRAANAGNIRAMHNLAVMIAESTDGKPDYDDAAMWFRKAAEFGVRDSQYNLAILYARGFGVEKNLSQSYIWFALAAGQGDTDAASKRDEIAAHLEPKQLADAKAIVDAFKPRSAPDIANNVDAPPGGWNALKTGALPAAKPTAGAKISTL